MNIKFKCTFLTDIIINQKSATEGNNQTLDFIPGSNFLGIVASKLYDELQPKSSHIIFHSGKVRFGDAHPLIEGIRSLRTPASMYYPKLKKASEECYIHHYTDLENDEIKDKQLKQCRNGFYAFKENEGLNAKSDKNFAIKSAYDREKRCSKDSKMYGYESLNKGAKFCFEVDFQEVDLDLVEKVKSALIGERRIGRSRSAQYGLVQIEESDYKEIESSKSSTNMYTVYAENRLIFLDGNAQVTFMPTLEQLGFSEGEIIWEKSQIRTFQYAPWNSRRQCFDTDRCGIEKGSVFIVESNTNPKGKNYIGSYVNEGFGKVIYNPAFLQADVGGLAKVKLNDRDDEKKKLNPDDAIKISDSETDSLLIFLREKKQEIKNQKKIYKKVNEFIQENASKFKDDRFASQWGAIRNIAMSHYSDEEIITKVDKYITHGVAKLKWNEKDRAQTLLNFIKKETDLRNLIINLASEMAKKSKK